MPDRLLDSSQLIDRVRLWALAYFAGILKGAKFTSEIKPVVEGKRARYVFSVEIVVDGGTMTIARSDAALKHLCDSNGLNNMVGILSKNS